MKRQMSDVKMDGDVGLVSTDDASAAVAAAHRCAAAAGTSGMPTPQWVLTDLVGAFGTEVAETGYEISAAKCCSPEEKATAREQGSSLLYGEMLPDGVSKALHEKLLGGALAKGDNGSVLELGMGSGKVALQVFLQCPSVKRVLGVELVESRFQLGAVALRRFVASNPKQFRLKDDTEGQLVKAEEIATGRLLEFRCSDFFTVGLDLTPRCDVIFFAVNIPCRLFPDLGTRLAQSKDGCRLFSYHALSTIWWSDAECPFHQVEDNKPESDTYSTSWSPQGFRFYVYVCDRKRPASIRNDMRNETYSEWQLIWDDKSQGYYFHNQESEVSQWEVPMSAGCWQAVWAEEHQAFYFCHTPSGFTQWEIPKCMADLGYGQPPAG